MNRVRVTGWFMAILPIAVGVLIFIAVDVTPMMAFTIYIPLAYLVVLGVLYVQTDKKENTK